MQDTTQQDAIQQFNYARMGATCRRHVEKNVDQASTGRRFEKNILYSTAGKMQN